NSHSSRVARAPRPFTTLSLPTTPPSAWEPPAPKPWEKSLAAAKSLGDRKALDAPVLVRLLRLFGAAAALCSVPSLAISAKKSAGKLNNSPYEKHFPNAFAQVMLCW